MRNKSIDKSIQILTAIYMALFITGSFSFAFYYPFGHLNDCNRFSFLYIFFQIIRLSAFILVPLAGFYFYKTPRNIVKTILPFLFIGLFFFYPQYCSLSKLDPTLPFYNDTGLDQTQIEIYNKINLFLPDYIIKSEYILEVFIVICIGILLNIKFRFKSSDLKSLLWFPLFITLSLPINLSENLTRTFQKETTEFLTFRNYGIWHFLLFLLLAIITITLYLSLKNKDRKTQMYVLRILCLMMFDMFFGKNSMLIGDGYNVYNTVFASVPLFICDIGKFIVFIAIMAEKKWFYQCAYFVHSAGALTVFFYLGKESATNFDTIFSYSFLYFTINHILLFVLSVLPMYLSMEKFNRKNIITSSLYYGVVIIIAAFTSVSVTNFVSQLTDEFGNTLSSPFLPNYAFTQICPLPMEFPTFLNFKIGVYEINFVYEMTLFISYVVLFLAFYFINELIYFLSHNIQSL